MDTDWRDHHLEVRGDWPARWLCLAPDYELWIDGARVDRAGGPRLRPTLQARLQQPDAPSVTVEADILSIAGMYPRCQLSVDGETVAQGRVTVRNRLNPFLMLIIIAGSAIMVYLGPAVIRAYWPF